ncbi:MAG: SDR family NAD(P)-dependent oxidoreductase [Sphingomonadales bacterium]|mgnify:CR=1 FL=1
MSETKRDMTGKVAIVTGAASGIGYAAAAQFAADGAKVLAVDLSPFEAADGILTLAQDVSEPDAAANIVGKALEAFGQIDILVNNAGICVPSPVETHSDDLWRKTMTINADACFNLSRAAIPALKKSAAGRIINVGSIMSDFGAAGMAAYSTSKHAVAGLTKSLANELGPDGITVNYIQPGAIRTGITKPTFANEPGFEDYWIDRAAIGRIGEPEDVTPLISFLASEEARFLTGEGILIDGGATSHP